jgi:hypothetical protein
MSVISINGTYLITKSYSSSVFIIWIKDDESCIIVALYAQFMITAMINLIHTRNQQMKLIIDVKCEMIFVRSFRADRTQNYRIRLSVGSLELYCIVAFVH